MEKPLPDLPFSFFYRAINKPMSEQGLNYLFSLLVRLNDDLYRQINAFINAEKTDFNRWTRREKASQRIVLINLECLWFSDAFKRVYFIPPAQNAE